MRTCSFALIVALSLSLLLCAATGTAVAAATTPTSGSVRLNAAQLKTVNGIRCGRIGRTWQAGASLRTRFISHTRRAANLAIMARSATGDRRTRLLAQARLYRTRAAQGRVPCTQPNGARKLPLASRLRVTGAQCGRIGRSWYSGALSRGYFVSNVQQYRNFKVQAAFARSTALATRMTRLSSSYFARHRKYSASCSRAGSSKLRFGLVGAAGLGLTAPDDAAAKGRAVVTAAGGSNLDVVTASGTSRDALVAGSAEIAKFLIAPNGQAYVLFNEATGLDGEGSISNQGCLLARVPRSSGVPACIDTQSNLKSISSYNGSPQVNPPIQFDGSGAVYYKAVASDGKNLLRRRSSSGVRDLIADKNVYVDHFFVTPDGSVFVFGTTQSTSTNWIRRITPDGGLQVLSEDAGASWFARFPDGNVYFQLSSRLAGNGIARYLPATGALDPQRWIGGPTDHFDQAACNCTMNMGSGFAFTANGAAFAADGNRTFIQWYPSVVAVSSSIAKPSVFAAVGNDLYVAGLDGSGHHALLVRDSITGSEQTLLDAGAEIEMYHLNYAPSKGLVYFDGLRFADNKYVIGSIDVSTRQVTVLSSPGARWDDFQTFS